MKFKIYAGVTGGPFELEAEDMLAAVAEVRRLEKVQVIAVSYFRDDIGQWVSGDAFLTGWNTTSTEVAVRREERKP